MQREYDRLESLSIRIDRPTRERLEAQAREQDRPLGWLIRKTLRDAARREQASEAA